MPMVKDQGDGSGASVTLEGVLDPVEVWSIQVEDSEAKPGVWRQVATKVGNGQVNIPVTDSALGVLIGRTYRVRRVGQTSGEIVGPELVTVTNQAAYPSDIYPAIVSIKEELIGLGLPKIGSKVKQCIDPRTQSSGAVPDHPCLWIFQPEPEVPAMVDNETAKVTYPIEIVISDSSGVDRIEDMEWWAHIRWRIFWHLFAVASKLHGPGKPYKNWRLSFGLVVPDDPSKYEFRAQSIRLTVECERRIGSI